MLSWNEYNSLDTLVSRKRPKKGHVSDMAGEKEQEKNTEVPVTVRDMPWLMMSSTSAYYPLWAPFPLD